MKLYGCKQSTSVSALKHDLNGDDPLMLAMQDSAKYAHALLKDLVCLFGRPVSIAYSPGGNTDS